MISIIVVFPKIENAKNIKSILVRSGYEVTAVCTTGSQALQVVNNLDGGVVVCGYRLADMMYEELLDYLPKGFEMLLVTSKANWAEREVEDLVCLPMPLKVQELTQTVNMMICTMRRKQKKKKARPRERTAEEKQCIEKAKQCLMERNNFSEQEAHRYIQKTSMDSGTDMVETAQMILSMIDDDKF
ncbi:MAG: ANTAR domain-containing response regulator [Lachnospiraceae bacterium]